MNTVLVGGLNNGKRISIEDDKRFIRMAYMEPLNPFWLDKDSKPYIPTGKEKDLFDFNKPIEQQSVKFTTEIYMRHTFRGITKDFDVFAEEHLSTDDIIEKLIDNYKFGQYEERHERKR
jgi:hypothetical protein